MTETPFFSVIIPTYNRGPLLIKSINSVLSQTYTDFELIIVDDGSTDNTYEVVMSFTDSRIHYYYKENEERNFARNFGIEKACGKYVCFLDSDDYYLPQHLSRAYQIITQTKERFLHFGYRVVDELGNEVLTVRELPEDVSESLIRDNYLGPNGIVVERFLLKSIGFIRSFDYIIGEDHLLWLQLNARSKLRIVNEVTVVMLEHPQRSLNIIDHRRFARGLNDMVNHIKLDQLFYDFYGNKVHFFIADRFRFGALLFAMSNERSYALKLLVKSVFISPTILLTRPFYGVVKNLLKN